jgi:hypothetical protein
MNTSENRSAGVDMWEGAIGMDTRPKIAAIKYIQTVLAQTKGTEKTKALPNQSAEFFYFLV